MESELEKRIKEHIEGCERMIRPSNNPIINKRIKELIVVLRSAPRDMPSLLRAIRIKERQLKAAQRIFETDRLVNELSGLERMRGFIAATDGKRERLDERVQKIPKGELKIFSNAC